MEKVVMSGESCHCDHVNKKRSINKIFSGNSQIHM